MRTATPQPTLVTLPGAAPGETPATVTLLARTYERIRALARWTAHALATEDGTAPDAARLAAVDDDYSAEFFRTYVGPITALELEDGTLIPDGATLWAQRDRVDPDHLGAIWAALNARERAVRLATSARLPLSPPSASPEPPPRNGTVPIVAPGDNTSGGGVTASPGLTR